MVSSRIEKAVDNSSTNSLSRKTDILTGVFVASLIAASLLGTKITTILSVSVSVGIFAYPITFLITDVITEVHGSRKARNVMLAGMVALVMTLLLVWISTALPAAERYEHNDAYTTVFSNSMRIIAASLIAFFLSQLHDIWAFGMWKKKTKGRFLWIRNNLSTMVSQFLDTVLFMFIAFYQVTPRFDVGFLFELIIPYWLLKVLFAAIDTPLVYAGVRWLRSGSRSQPSDPTVTS